VERERSKNVWGMLPKIPWIIEQGGMPIIPTLIFTLKPQPNQNMS
jgi:hypothetical protein